MTTNHKPVTIDLLASEHPLKLLITGNDLIIVNELRSMLEGLGYQVTVGVADIADREVLEEREREKTILLSLADKIATIRDRQDLFTVIFDEVKPLFRFDNAVVALYDETLTYTRHLYANEQYYDNAHYQYIMTHRVATAGNPHGEFATYPEPRILSLSYLKSRYPEHVGVNVMESAGLLECVIMPLWFGGKLLATLEFHSCEEQRFNPLQLPLFRHIADQIAVAVANILANEEILEREREKTVLLSVSEAIAAIRDKQNLLQVIIDKIKPMFTFYDCGLFVFDATRQHLEDLTVSLPAISPSAGNQLLTGLDKAAFPYKDSAFEWLFGQLRTSGEPIIYNYGEIDVPRWADYVQAPVLDQIGYKESLICLLKAGGQEIGAFMVNSLQKGTFQKNQFRLFQTITDQIAVAVANILANEEILEREREKAQLLKISEAIARVQTYQELLDVIRQQITPVFPNDDVGLFILDSVGTNYVRLVRHTDAKSQSTQPVLEGPFPYRGHNPNSWEYAGAPIICSIAQQADYLPANEPLQKARQLGLRQMIGGPLYGGGRKVGFLSFNTRQEELYVEQSIPFFKVISELVAIAISNILANENIRQREQEKDLQINLTQVLTRAGDWSEKLVSLCTLLQPWLTFDYFMVWMEQGEHTFYQGVRQIGYDEYQVIDRDALLRMMSLDAEKYTSQLRELSQEDAQVLTTDSFGPFVRRFRLAGALADLFKLESALLLPVHLASQTKLLIWVSSQTPDRYTPADSHRFRASITAITPSLEKILAYEEIRQLKEQLEVEQAYLKEEIKTTHNFDEIVGSSESLQQVFRRINLVAATDSTVLLEGETGTGKELFARAIHSSSPRRDRVLVKVNCAALPANLIESELFGHEKGAFTGAIDRRIGKFELAHGGTLFLDEIGELPLDLQPKLLRALQEKEIERVGGRQIITCDVRIIAATNRDLEREVAGGRFRQDLFYRLHVFAIGLPPLRQRPGDIELLANHFLHKFAKQFGRPARGFSTNAMREMQAYDWPGNIRELEHVIEQSLILSESPTIELAKLLKRTNRLDGNPESPPLKTWQDAERDNILAVLKFTDGRIRGKGGAAELLGINASTLDSRMKTLNITRSFGKNE